jgi:hypothetical protein
VYSFHLFALSMYCTPSISPTHSMISSYCACADDVVGWGAKVASMWLAESPGVVVCSGVACVRRVVVVVVRLSHKIEAEEEEK